MYNVKESTAQKENKEIEDSKTEHRNYTTVRFSRQISIYSKLRANKGNIHLSE